MPLPFIVSFVYFCTKYILEMAKEIERKFLVKDSSYRHMASSSSHIEQGYLSRDPEATVRVRVRDDRAFLTV